MRWKHARSEQSAPVIEDTLHQTMADLTLIQSLLPCLPTTTLFPDRDLTVVVVLRSLAVVYVPYLFLTYFVRLRVLVALVGTFVLTWRARWALLVRRALWRSAYIRWGIHLAWSRISGQPLPPRGISPEGATLRDDVARASSSGSPTRQRPTNAVRFLFTVFENQRWWVGLDFTAALLPGERPSWATSSQQPVNPPATFTLPAPTTVYLPDPGRRSGRIKHTARWTWEEPEWRVVVRKEGSPATRVERPLPALQDENAIVSASRLLKAAGRMRQSSLSEGSPERQKKDGIEQDRDELEMKSSDRGDDTAQEEPYTDADGWVYGDNKWEGESAKGGMGKVFRLPLLLYLRSSADNVWFKFTRYRRWTRVAVLSETVEHVEAGELHPDGSLTQSSHHLPPLILAGTKIEQPLQLSPVSQGAQATISSPAEDERSRLRQRLKAAVKGGSLSVG